MNNVKKGLKYSYLPQPIGLKSVEPLDETSDYYDLLTNCLTGDIMIDKSTCEEILQLIQDIEDDKIKENEFSGNACTTTIRKDDVEIDMILGDEILTTVYPLHIFKKAVEEWYDFIKTGRERILEFDYPVDE